MKKKGRIEQPKNEGKGLPFKNVKRAKTCERSSPYFRPCGLPAWPLPTQGIHQNLGI
jgi:hypothetical protein